MMTCERCRDILSEFLEGELSPSAEAEAREHLARCPACARELAELRALVAALHGLPEVEPPAELRARLRRIPDEAVRGDAWRRARFIATSVAAAAAALLIVWTGITHYQGRPGVDLTTAPPIARPAPPAVEELVAAEPDEVAPESAPEAALVESAAAAPSEPAADDTTPARPAREHRAERSEGPLKSVAETGETAAAAEVVPPPASTRIEGATEPESVAPPATGTAPPAGMVAMETSRAPAGAAGPVGPAGPAGPAGPRGPAGPAPAPDVMAGGAAPEPLRVPDAVYLDARGSGPATATDTGEGSPFVISIIPPRQRVVDEIVAATVTLETEKAVDRALLNVTASPGLELVDVKPDGELFAGPLRAGQETVLSLHMMAREPGGQSIMMRLRSTDPIVDTQLGVRMGEFAEPVPPAERPVQFTFTDTPIGDAAAELSRQSGLRIDVAPECAGRAVTVAAPDPVPAGAAVRSVAAAAGCDAREQDEGMVIEPTQE